VIKLGKKNKKINVIKNSQNLDLTFVKDPRKELMERYSDQQGKCISTNESHEKLVKKARRDNKFTRSVLQNKSKHVLSKQNHSPVYE
jgi:hypothetical protein